MKMKKSARRAFAALAAGAVATMLALGGASAASAADGADGPLILPGEGGSPITGTVTVHKHEQGNTAGAPANGLEQTVTTATIPGVTFTAQQVESVTADGKTYEFDLTTNQGWLNATDLVRDDAGTWTYNGVAVTDVAYGETITRTTGPEDGPYEDAVFADLPVGLYLFTETDAPARVTMSAPWVMTVPLTDPTDTTSWNYDLHVYPKNSITGVTKTVQDAGATSVGDAISWTITGDIPLVANPDFDGAQPVGAANLKFFAPTAYVVKDKLDERLTPASTTPVLVALENGGTVALDAADYGVVWTPGSAAGATLTLTFTEAGRDKLGLAVSQAADPSSVKVKVTLNTIVTTLTGEDEETDTIGDGIIKNQAQLFPNQGAVDSDTPVLSNEPETRWGDILIEKVDASNNGSKLEGAEFQVFTTEANAIAGNTPISINGESTFTTDENGVVRISGLRYSDFANNAPITDEADWQYYWIVETKAPEGYELLAEPIRVTVTQAQQAVEHATVIENAPTNGFFELPLTGGVGTTMFTVAGLLLVGAGLVFAFRKKKSVA